MEQQPEGAQVWREILDLDFDTTMRFWNSPKPTIAAVHGVALMDPNLVAETKNALNRTYEIQGMPTALRDARFAKAQE